ncbi:unnamed protein product [Brassica rapa subsp. narinosa]
MTESRQTSESLAVQVEIATDKHTGKFVFKPWSGLGQRITYSGSGVDHHGPYAQSGNTRRPNPPQRHYTSCGRSLSDESSPSSNVFDESDPPFRMFSDNQTLIRAINDKRFEKEI